MSGVVNILSGWANVLFRDEKVERIANSRAKICDSCIYKKNKLDVEYCSRCTCPIIAKTRSLKEKCPINKW